jgi:outer membrane protein TolC
VQTSATDAGLRVGPGVEQSLSPSRGRAARVAAAEARVDARRVDLDATTRELESRLRILTAEGAAARDRLAATQAAAQANRANLSAARDQFDVGRRSLIELLDAEREALASEQQRIGAEHDRAMVGYAALAVTGDLLDVFGIRLPRPGQPGGDSGQ